MTPEEFKLRQAEYRAYLNTPLWKSIRRGALVKYGCICARCGESGNDVHHKTYERVGGSERIEDLEVLCRPCHAAHHAVDKVCSSSKKKKRKSNRGMHVTGALNYLKPHQKELMTSEFSRSYHFTVYEQDTNGDNVRNRIMELLGLNYLYGMRICDNSRRMSVFPAMQEIGKSLRLSKK